MAFLQKMNFSNRLFIVTVLLASFTSACEAKPLVLPTSTTSPTEVYNFIHNNPSTIVPQSDTPTRPNPSPTITVVEHSALNTSGPYLTYMSMEGDQHVIVFLDADGIGQKLIPYPANATNIPYTLTNTLSPNGQWLAYYTGSAGKCFGNPGADTADLTLNLLNLTDGKSQVVTRLLSHDYPDNFGQGAQQLNEEGISADLLQNAFVCGIHSSAWSPDGRYLAFAGQMDGLSSDVYLYDMNSHAIKRLSDEPEEVERISWSPDGQRILEWSNFWYAEGMAHDVYVISLDGEVIFKVVIYRGFLDWLYSTTYTFWGLENGMEPIQSGFVDIETGKVKIWDPEYDFLAVSADKQWLAASYSSGLYLVNLSTSKSIRVELPGEFEGNKSTFQAIGSGDQTFGFLNSSDNNLYFLSPEGKLTSTDINATSLSLSPDRQYLVAVGQKIHILKADGTPIRDVDLPTEQKNDSVFAIIWRPDASGIFFTVCDLLISDNAPNTRFYAMDLLTGGLMLVDPLSPTLNEEFFWVAKSK